MTVRVYMIEWVDVAELNDRGEVICGGDDRRTMVMGRDRAHAWRVFEAEHGGEFDIELGASQTNIRAVAGCTEMY